MYFCTARLFVESTRAHGQQHEKGDPAQSTYEYSTNIPGIIVLPVGYSVATLVIILSLNSKSWRSLVPKEH